MKPTLALDPGITTGYAYFEDDELKLSGNLLAEDLDDSILLELAEIEGLEVVIEDVPIPTRSQLNFELQKIIGWLQQRFPNAVSVKPSWWKTNLYIRHRSLPASLGPHPTQHQLDAFYIGIFYKEFIHHEG